VTTIDRWRNEESKVKAVLDISIVVVVSFEASERIECLRWLVALGSYDGKTKNKASFLRSKMEKIGRF
jgi:hypothetical protein